MEKMTLLITPEAIHKSERFGLRNPILCALQNTTGTLWRVYDDGMVLEVMTPYRACSLPDEAMERWREYRATGIMKPFSVTLEFRHAEERDGYSLGQKRRILAA